VVELKVRDVYEKNSDFVDKVLVSNTLEELDCFELLDGLVAENKNYFK